MNTAQTDEFCSSCGFPLGPKGCEACGNTGGPRRLTEGRRRELAPVYEPSELIGLETALEAYKRQDFARAVECVVILEGGASTRAGVGAQSLGWIARLRGASLFVSLAADRQLTVRVPVVRVPERQRVPVLRVALELSVQASPTSRFSLREDLLVLRFSSGAHVVPPPLLRRLLRDLADNAARTIELLGVRYDALGLTPGEDLSFDVLGRTREVRLGPETVRTGPPPKALAETPELPTLSEKPTPRSVGSAGPRSSGAKPSSQPPTVIPPSSQPPSKQPQTVAGIAPAATSLTPPVMPATLRRGANAPAPSAPGRPTERPKVSPDGPISKGSLSRPTPVDDQELPAILAPMFAARAPTVRPPPNPPPSATPDTAGGSAPADALCALLRQAEALSSVALRGGPSTLVWLLRAAAFRASASFGEALPDAVAHLLRAAGLGRTPPDPPLLVLRRVIAARAEVPREPMLKLDPFTNTAAAKDHIARCITEIERAPADASLRHFIALGALTEILVRAKLPAQTEQRLRSIIEHAEREGPKPHVNDHLMATLKRIATG